MTIGIDGDNGIDDGAGGPADFVKQWASKGFCKFNGSNGTVAKSQNVSSVTDNGVGTFTVNLTNAMASTDESPFSSGAPTATPVPRDGPAIIMLTTSTIRIVSGNGGGGAADWNSLNFVIFGDLA